MNDLQILIMCISFLILFGAIACMQYISHSDSKDEKRERQEWEVEKEKAFRNGTTPPIPPPDGYYS